MSTGGPAAIPESAWRIPLLRELDALAREHLAAASAIRDVAIGGALWQENDRGDAIVVVLAGRVELRGTRRGEDTAVALRLAAPGDTLGEEALLRLPRRATAVATEPTRVLEMPAALFLRGSGRSHAASAVREIRALERQATWDLLRQQSLGRTLGNDDLDLLVDAVKWERYERGARIFGAGEPAHAAWLLCDGLVQLQTEDDERVHVRAYIARGDTLGDEETLAAVPRSCNALALGPVSALRVPADVLRTLVDRNPGLVSEFSRIATARGEAQREVVGAAAALTTQHVFRDLYRMQMARSMLVIDQDTCVRCGHCAWTCASLHGTSRLVRRGDKVVTKLSVLGEEPRSLLLPNSCQHCKNPACMIDCPTGAIGRDPHGEVFIRAELCTGCGNCAKACPWDNIRIQPRPDAPAGVTIAARRQGLRLSPEVAVKCDLCRDYDGPGCVQTCPTGAILRLDPTRDVAEVARVLGVASEARRASVWARLPIGTVLGALVVALAVAGGIAGLTRQQVGAWTPGSGAGWIAGIVAAVCTAVLALHSVVKRVVRLWVRPRSRRRALAGVEQGAPRSRVRKFVGVHVVIGLAAPAAVLAHAGLRLPDGPAGALVAAWWATALLGIIGGLAYAIVPRRLTRLERDGALPEDLAARRVELVDRLYRAGSGKSDLVKAIAERILVPYARSALGPLVLVASGRTLAKEESRVRGKVDAMLQGRGTERLGGMDELVRIVVELRALPARRVLTAALRGFLPLHIVATSAVLVLLAIHVLVEVGR